MNMSQVTSCEIEKCAYNHGKSCHAFAITIGDGKAKPNCDTYCDFDLMGGVPNVSAGVGACKVYDCKHNQNLECGAQKISVGLRGSEVDCMTYTPV